MIIAQIFNFTIERKKKMPSTMNLKFSKGELTSLCLNGRERLFGSADIFQLQLRDSQGEAILLGARDAATVRSACRCTTYSDFSSVNEALGDLWVKVKINKTDNKSDWSISFGGISEEFCFEYTDFPRLSLPLLKDNQEGSGQLLLPYNEGVLISDASLREARDATKYREITYPSHGSYYMFPNMMQSQMCAYLWDDAGLYYGAHDPKRGLKNVDYFCCDNRLILRIRHYCGADFGKDWEMDYPTVLQAVGSEWESAAEVYREWFESELPAGVKKIKDNTALPEWYKDSPLVVAYPIRGHFDRDVMTPNKLYPYTNAEPILNEIKEKTQSRIMALLMHWESTAPWAPPYVWPPFGDVDNFNKFRDDLHSSGDLLGLYCSGFGYTEKSCLVEEYDNTERIEKEGILDAVCAAPDQSVSKSIICTMQRSGYDLCPASAKGKEIVNEAYAPLFKEAVDYIQILDQNHGGGQYLCYSKKHGHPPVPGKWMTERMQELLHGWNKEATNMLFGCESAAGEPFIGELLFSDNRYELNFRIGVPVPLYSYIYHEYLRNFMGNQCGCPLTEPYDTLRYRLAYSFAIGDSMSILLRDDGGISSFWGSKGAFITMDKEKVLTLVKNLTSFYKAEGKSFLSDGRMIAPLKVDCPDFTVFNQAASLRLPSVISTAWDLGDKKLQLLVNPYDDEVTCTVGERQLKLAPMSAISIEI